MAELRSLAIDFLKDAQADQRGALDKAQAEAKDRELALQFARLMQQLLRDWSLLGEEHLIHSDLAPTLSALTNAAPKTRVELWRQAFQLETDIVAHIDRALCLENFYYRARQALR